MSLQNILLVGATGRVGSAVIRALLSQKDKFTKFGAVTSPASYADPAKKAKWAALEQQGVQIISVDLTDTAAMTEAFRGWDAVVAALAFPAAKVQFPIIDAAAAAGVKRFIPSEFGFDLTIPSNRAERIYAVKVAVSECLKAVAEAQMDFSYTLLAIGAYADFAFMPPYMFLDYDFAGRKVTIAGDGNAEISWTSFDDSASFVVAILLHPEETKNTVVRVHGQAATWNDVIKILEEAQGVKYDVTHESVESVREKESQAWEAGSPAVGKWALRRFMAEGNARIKEAQLMNKMFPEVKITTDMKRIVRDVLTEGGVKVVP